MTNHRIGYSEYFHLFFGAFSSFSSANLILLALTACRLRSARRFATVPFRATFGLALGDMQRQILTDLGNGWDEGSALEFISLDGDLRWVLSILVRQLFVLQDVGFEFQSIIPCIYRRCRGSRCLPVALPSVFRLKFLRNSWLQSMPHDVAVDVHGIVHS
ncbi:hypothetical protein F5146DRAFT_1067908 [Armillaria mellea]|nr:hypothetical protein F5146DRAFT_1067908 [Armillaria mellea]